MPTTEEQKQVLTAYKCGEASLGGTPLVNYLLRDGKTCEWVQILDNLMAEGDTPDVLYRVLAQENICIEEGEIICDWAFLSTTSDMSYIPNFMVFPQSAILIINSSSVRSINVVKVLGNTNDEHEFILPRNLRLHIIDTDSYEQNTFESFLQKYDIGVSYRELIDIQQVETITVYKVEPIIDELNNNN